MIEGWRPRYATATEFGAAPTDTELQCCRHNRRYVQNVNTSLDRVRNEGRNET